MKNKLLGLSVVGVLVALVLLAPASRAQGSMSFRDSVAKYVAQIIAQQLLGEIGEPMAPSVNAPGQNFGAVGSLRVEDYIPVILYNDGYYSERPLSVSATTTLDTTTLVVNPNENRVGIGIANPKTQLQLSGGELSIVGTTAQLTNQDGLMLWGGTNGGTIYARGNNSGGDDDLVLKFGNKATLQDASANVLFTVSDEGTTGRASTTDFILSGVFDMTTTTPTTTLGFYQRTRPALKATTTVSIGETLGDDVKGCIELVRADGTYMRIIGDGGATPALNLFVGRCSD